MEQRTPPGIAQGKKIFVLGPPRSGTTLIYSLIAGDCFLPECTFVSTLIESFHQIYKNGDNERFDYYGHTLANLVEIFRKPIYDFLYTASLKVGGVSKYCFIYKDPMLTHYLEYLPLFFGDNYKVLFCIRDPRDVVASMLRVLQKKNEAAEPDALFDEAIHFIFPFYKAIYRLDNTIDDVGRDKILFVRYEHLVTGREETLRDLETFLGITVNLHSVNESMIARLDQTSPFYSENYGKPITTRLIGSYQDSLTAEQIARIEHVFSYYMLKLKYR